MRAPPWFLRGFEGFVLISRNDTARGESRDVKRVYVSYKHAICSRKCYIARSRTRKIYTLNYIFPRLQYSSLLRKLGEGGLTVPRRMKVYYQKKCRRYRAVFAGEHLKTCSVAVKWNNLGPRVESRCLSRQRAFQRYRANGKGKRLGKRRKRNLFSSFPLASFLSRSTFKYRTKRRDIARSWTLIEPPRSTATQNRA